MSFPLYTWYDFGFKTYAVKLGEPQFKEITVEFPDGNKVVISAPYNVIKTSSNAPPINDASQHLNFGEMAREFQKVAATLANIEGIELPPLRQIRAANTHPWWGARAMISSGWYALRGKPKAP